MHRGLIVSGDRFVATAAESAQFNDRNASGSSEVFQTAVVADKE